MELNSDFSRRAIVHAGSLLWVPTPVAGVERRMLDRLGDEVARATSLVRYAPGSAFPAHTHGGGEEFFVLEGTFRDEEHGDYPVNTYCRNPPTSRHTPSSPLGCVIFVKLWQMNPDDRTQVIVHAPAAPAAPAATSAPGAAPAATVRALFADAHEDVSVRTWAPREAVALDGPRGIEVFVLRGSLESAGGEALGVWSWLRLPDGSRLEATAGIAGAEVFVKLGRSTAALAAPPTR
jgi:hypothetical protein